jgi:hypothetical protein
MVTIVVVALSLALCAIGLAFVEWCYVTRAVSVAFAQIADASESS